MYLFGLLTAAGAGISFAAAIAEMSTHQTRYAIVFVLATIAFTALYVRFGQ